LEKKKKDSGGEEFSWRAWAQGNLGKEACRVGVSGVGYQYRKNSFKKLLRETLTKGPETI